MYPILIGSRAVHVHRDDSDFDLIIPQDVINIKVFSGLSSEVDLFTRPYDQELLVYLNTSDTIKLETLPNGNDVIIPPDDVLAMIYLSSIFRIVPYTDDHKTNIRIWNKRVNTYNTLRSRIDYQKFDRMLLESDDFIAKNFYKRVEHKFAMFGDTKNSLTKKLDVFFEDGVPRKFDHDWLHKQVALVMRNTDVLIFPEVQDSESVGIDENKFNALDSKRKIQMFQEEIITLMLERKIIPVLEHTDYIIDQYCDDMEDISSHFATNLCGQGMHFLRRWVLDHYYLIMMFPIIPSDIIALAYKITGHSTIKKQTICPTMTPEMARIYEILIIKNGADTIDGLDLKTGYGNDSRGRYFLTIEMLKISNGCLFTQYYIDATTSSLVLTSSNTEITKTLETRETVTTITTSGYYHSVAQCNEGDGYVSRDEESRETVVLDEQKEEKRIIYLNSYGNFPLGDKLTRLLISKMYKDVITNVISKSVNLTIVSN